MYEFLRADIHRNMSVYECGKEECVAGKSTSLSRENHHLFFYVASGKGTLILNNKEYHIGRNNIFFVPKKSDAVYYPDKDDPWFYYWVGFDGYACEQGLLEYLNITIDNPVVPDPQRNYRQYFDSMIKHFNKSGYLDIYMVGSLCQLFGEIYYQQEGKDTNSPVQVTIRIAKKFIENNYQSNITIVDVAKNANVTPNYLSTIFKKEEKMSTKRYLTKVRMTKAMELLQSGLFKVKDVGEMVGYDNQLHFSSEFRKYYGNPPSHFIKTPVEE